MISGLPMIATIKESRYNYLSFSLFIFTVDGVVRSSDWSPDSDVLLLGHVLQSLGVLIGENEVSDMLSSVECSVLGILAALLKNVNKANSKCVFK